MLKTKQTKIIMESWNSFVNENASVQREIQNNKLNLEGQVPRDKLDKNEIIDSNEAFDLYSFDPDDFETELEIINDSNIYPDDFEEIEFEDCLFANSDDLSGQESFTQLENTGLYKIGELTIDGHKVYALESGAHHVAEWIIFGSDEYWRYRRDLFKGGDGSGETSDDKFKNKLGGAWN